MAGKRIDSRTLTIVPPGGGGRVSPANLSIRPPGNAISGPWKTTYDIPGGNGLVAASPIMNMEDAVDYIVDLGRQWGDLMPELKDVDPEMPGIGGVVIEGEHVQGPPRMLGGTLHGDCGDFLCNSAAIYQARGELRKRPDGLWESPMGIATLFEQPEAAQDHVAWSEYDHLATRPRQVGGWFDVVKGLVKKAAPAVLRQVTSTVAPWATPLISPVLKRAPGVLKAMFAPGKGKPKQLPGPMGPMGPQYPPGGFVPSMYSQYSGQPMPGRRRSVRPRYAQPTTGRRTAQLPMSWKAAPMPTRPWRGFPTRSPGPGKTPLYLPPQYTSNWGAFRF